MFVKALCKLSVSQSCLETQFLRKRWMLQNLLVHVVERGWVCVQIPALGGQYVLCAFLPLERQQLHLAGPPHGAQPEVTVAGVGGVYTGMSSPWESRLLEGGVSSVIPGGIEGRIYPRNLPSRWFFSTFPGTNQCPLRCDWR